MKKIENNQKHTGCASMAMALAGACITGSIARLSAVGVVGITLALPKPEQKEIVSHYIDTGTEIGYDIGYLLGSKIDRLFTRSGTRPEYQGLYKNH